MVCVALPLLWFEWIGMTETWTRENNCAQLPLLPKLLCPLLSPLDCAFQRLVIHTAVTVHILELCPLPASLAPLPVLTNPHMPGHRSQYTSFKPHNEVVSCASPPLLHISMCVSAARSPSLAVAYILWLFLGNCDSQRPLSVMLPALSLYSSHSPIIWLPCVGSGPSRSHISPRKVAINSEPGF